MFTKNTLFFMPLLFVCTMQIQAVPTCNYSKFKLGATSIISGLVVAAISSSLATEGFNRPITKVGAAFSAFAGLLSSLVGYKVTSDFFTPEGQLSRVWTFVCSIDRSLLDNIETSSSFEEFNEKIKWTNRVSSNAGMKILEYLEEKRDKLFEKEEMIKGLNFSFYPHIKDDVDFLRERLIKTIILCQKGIDLVKSDPEFYLKWQAYLLEKQLNAIKHELSAMKWHMILSDTSNYPFLLLSRYF